MSRLVQIKGFSKLIGQLRQYPHIMGEQATVLMRKNTRTLVSSSGTVPGLVQVTPPFSQGIRGLKAKAQGETAITAELLGFRGGGGRRTGGVFCVMADDLLAKNAKVHEGGATVRLFVKTNGEVYGCDRALFKPRASISEMYAHHQSMRRKDGRVSEAGGRTRDIGRWKFITQMVVSRSAYLRYERFIHKRVGMLAAAIVAAYNGKYGSLNGVPAWIARHTSSWASGSMIETPLGHGGLIVRLSIDAGALNSEMQRRFDYVLDYRLRAMQRETPYVLRAAAKQAGSSPDLSMFDLLFTSIVHGYLDTDASRAAGIPAAAECALMKMDSDEDEKDPSIIIMAVETGENRSRQVAVVALAKGTKPRSITDTWLNAVRARLADQEPLYAFIAALPVEQRTGYQIEAISPPNSAKVQRDPMAHIEVGVGIIFHITLPAI